MGIELYYAPIDDSRTIRLDELTRRFSEVALRVTIEPDSEGMSWIGFEGYDSTLLASVNDGQYVFGTLQVVGEDDASLVERVDAVMCEAGYSAGEDFEIGSEH